jgi:oxygen-independent coproporphyrinogen-3 oxidase
METGLYLHIPFCRKACHYCDFHFSTNTEKAEAMTQAMLREMEIRLMDAQVSRLQTLYFGGGTPSFLPSSQIGKFLNTAHRLAKVDAGAEITLEANPEDVTKEKLSDWKSMGINRLSIGLQSSHDQRLLWMNRNHSARDGEFAVKRAQDAGFDNITVDLMYGFPETSAAELREDIAYILSLQTRHISAYNLSIEPNTVFGRQWKKGSLLPLPEEESAARFMEVFDALEAAGYLGYEISNFAVPGFEAVHNRNYWLQKSFIGIGPSAHGFDGKSTRWENIPSNATYLNDLESGRLSEKVEQMSISSLANEFILTRLRMKEGLSLSLFAEKFGIRLEKIRESEIRKAADQAYLEEDADKLKLSRSGRLMADYIALELFTDKEDFR